MFEEEEDDILEAALTRDSFSPVIRWSGILQHHMLIITLSMYMIMMVSICSVYTLYANDTWIEKAIVVRAIKEATTTMTLTEAPCPPLNDLLDYIDHHPCELYPVQQLRKCIKWLKDYRNPCFHLPPVNISSINVTDASTIRCLPFYYLIGFPKCGSTDLYESISRHPTMVRAGKKEPHWWSRRRLWKKEQGFQTIRFYISVYLARVIAVKKRPNGFHNMITGEGSVSTIWDNQYNRLCPGRNITNSLELTTAHFIKALTPDARFIVIMRNPTDRLYSDFLYFYFNRKMTLMSFHNQVLTAVNNFNNCSELYGRETCARNYIDLCSETKKMRLEAGMYYVFIQDWINTFSRKQIHFVRLETYTKIKKNVTNDIFNFLEIGSPSSFFEGWVTRNTTLNERPGEQKKLGPMLNITRQLLDEFYRPFNEKLAKLLNDKSYLWLS